MKNVPPNPLVAAKPPEFLCGGMSVQESDAIQTAGPQTDSLLSLHPGHVDHKHITAAIVEAQQIKKELIMTSQRLDSIIDILVKFDKALNWCLLVMIPAWAIAAVGHALVK